MLRTWCRSKISRVTLTGVELDYEGSITLPPELIVAADMLPGEHVHVLNLDNGERLETYIIEGKAGSGEVLLNGPAAHKGKIGQKVMVLSYAMGDASEVRLPKITRVDKNNRAIKD